MYVYFTDLLLLGFETCKSHIPKTINNASNSIGPDSLTSSIERMKVEKKLSNHPLKMTVVGLHKNLCFTNKVLSHTSLPFDHLLSTPSFTKVCTLQGIRGIKTTSCYISKHNSLRNLQIIETQKAFRVRGKNNHSYKVGPQ